MYNERVWSVFGDELRQASDGVSNNNVHGVAVLLVEKRDNWDICGDRAFHFKNSAAKTGKHVHSCGEYRNPTAFFVRGNDQWFYFSEVGASAGEECNVTFT